MAKILPKSAIIENLETVRTLLFKTVKSSVHHLRIYSIYGADEGEEENDDEDVEPPSRKCPRPAPSEDAEESLPSLQVVICGLFFVLMSPYDRS